MTSETPTVAYLNSTWLDADVIDTTGGTACANSYITYTYPWTTTYYTTPTRIRLTLSDVEHLRKCAAKDAKLKKALRKIAPYIEVEVDFP